MSMYGLLTAVFSLLAAIHVDVAPDQPLPYTYVDDPIILEVSADEDVMATVQMELVAAGSERRYTLSEQAVALRKRGTAWVAFPDAPSERGFYTVLWRIQHEQGTESGHHILARIDRPPKEKLGYVAVDGFGSLPNGWIALHHCGIAQVRLPGNTENCSALVSEAVQRGFTPIVQISLKQDPPSHEALSALFNAGQGRIVRLDVSAAEADVKRTASFVQAVRALAPATEVALEVQSAEGAQAVLDALMSMNAAYQLPAPLSLLVNDDKISLIPAFRRQLYRNGIEGAKVYCVISRPFTPTLSPVFRALAQGASGCVIPTSWLYDDTLNLGFALVAGLAHRFPSFERAFFLPKKGEAATANGVFFPDAPSWSLVLFKEATKQEFVLDCQNISNLLITDAFNNVQSELTKKTEDANAGLTLSLEDSPIYVSGIGGKLPATVAAQTFAERCNEILSNEIFRNYLPPTLIEAVQQLSANLGKDDARQAFFLILRMFPELEQGWHAGKIPRGVAIDAQAILTDLLLAFGVLEQERGATLLEPLQDILLRCDEFQSLYLTGFAGTQQEAMRGDWILATVRKLKTSAERSAESGLKTQGIITAAIAEWRARSLEATMTPPKLLAAVEKSIARGEIPVMANLPGGTSGSVLGGTNAAGTRAKVHKVVAGDTLSSVAKKYGLKTQELLQWNQLKPNQTLRIGQELIVAQEVGAPTTVSPSKPSETVPQGTKSNTPEAASSPQEAQSVATETKTTAAPVAPTPRQGEIKKHTVASGENPWIIARKYNIRVEDLLSWNNLSRKQRLQVGQQLIVSPQTSAEPTSSVPESPKNETPSPSPPPVENEKKAEQNLGSEAQTKDSEPVEKPEPAAPTATEEEAKAAPSETHEPNRKEDVEKIIHTVQRGETTFSIAEKYGVPEADFRKWNGIRAGAQLKAGKQYIVYISKGKAATPGKGEQKSAAERRSDEKTNTSVDEKKKIIHTVAKGDNPYTIAKKYGVSLEDFLRWNNLTEKSRLQIGEKYVIYPPEEKGKQ